MKQLDADTPNTAAMLVSVDEDNSKITCLCQVPNVSVSIETCAKRGQRSTCNFSVCSISNVVFFCAVSGGARVHGQRLDQICCHSDGGGSKTTAQASGTSTDKVSQVLELAREFAKCKLDS